MIKEFQFSYEELNIQPEDLTLLLGFDDGVIPEPFPDIIKQALADAPNFCTIRGGYKIFETIQIDQNKTERRETGRWDLLRL